MKKTKEKPLIIIDTREQKPYVFSDQVETVHRKLDAGDYSLDGYEGKVAVERKTLDDFIGTVIHERERFVRELERLRNYDRVAIVVEGDLRQVFEHRYTSAAHPNSIAGSGIAFEIDYGIPVHWIPDRQHAQWWVEKYLIRFWNKAKGHVDEQHDRENRRKNITDVWEEVYPPWLL